jgi:hypothetical protein
VKPSPSRVYAWFQHPIGLSVTTDWLSFGVLFWRTFIFRFKPTLFAEAKFQSIFRVYAMLLCRLRIFPPGIFLSWVCLPIQIQETRHSAKSGSINWIQFVQQPIEYHMKKHSSETKESYMN